MSCCASTTRVLKVLVEVTGRPPMAKVKKEADQDRRRMRTRSLWLEADCPRTSV